MFPLASFHKFSNCLPERFWINWKVINVFFTFNYLWLIKFRYADFTHIFKRIPLKAYFYYLNANLGGGVDVFVYFISFPSSNFIDKIVLLGFNLLLPFVLPVSLNLERFKKNVSTTVITATLSRRRSQCDQKTISHTTRPRPKTILEWAPTQEPKTRFEWFLTRTRDVNNTMSI